MATFLILFIPAVAAWTAESLAPERGWDGAANACVALDRLGKAYFEFARAPLGFFERRLTRE